MNRSLAVAIMFSATFSATCSAENYAIYGATIENSEPIQDGYEFTISQSELMPKYCVGNKILIRAESKTASMERQMIYELDLYKTPVEFIAYSRDEETLECFLVNIRQNDKESNPWNIDNLYLYPVIIEGSLVAGGCPDPWEPLGYHFWKQTRQDKEAGYWSQRFGGRMEDRGDGEGDTCRTNSILDHAIPEGGGLKWRVLDSRGNRTEIKEVTN